jgi:2-oxoglutarate ferredoxin oxidoreductase subunit alpha
MSGQKEKITVPAITVRFAGDSGDGMQLTGDQFADTTAVMGNDFATLPDFPAEIRAPAGTLPGVSSFQIQFSDTPIYTPGDISDVLIAMNPAALKVNIKTVKKGGLMIINENTFNETGLRKANYAVNPLTDDTLKDFRVLKVSLTDLTRNALKEHPIKATEVERCKNFFALGMMFWLYDRQLEHTVNWITAKFAKRPEIVNANIAALKAGYNFADIAEVLDTQYRVEKTQLEPGTYRKIMGNEATAIGLVAGAVLANKTLFYGSYPITPASSILEGLSRLKNFGVKTFQAEDEIAAIGATIGAAFGGAVSITGTSGPGMCLKSEALNLAVMAELPIVVVNVQRSGPSTGMPTKTEQTDLLQAMFGRNGESPVAIVAPSTASNCFDMAVEAVRIAVTYMVPVVYLSEGYLSSASEPWKLPDIASLKKFEVKYAKAEAGVKFQPYLRDPKTLARPWAIPGTPGLEHRIGGLSKAVNTGNVSYDPDNNQKMMNLRAEKVQRIAESIPALAVRGDQSGKLLVLGWGGTYGPIYQAVEEIMAAGKKVSQAHLYYLNPFPKNIKEVLSKFERILIPELNSGHLTMLLRNAFPEFATKIQGLNKVQGQPFKVFEISTKIKELV